MINNKKSLKEILSLYPRIKWQLLMITIISLLILIHIIGENLRYQKNNPYILRENLSDIQSILLSSQGKEPFSLERKEKDSWNLISYDVLYPNDPKIIQNFLSSLEGLKGTPLSEEELSYQLNTLPSLVFYDENREEKEVFFLGERNTAKREIFLKRKSDNKVFLSPDIFSLTLAKGKESFIENKIFPSQSSFEPISLEIDIYQAFSDFPNLKENQKIIFSKTKKGWKSNLGSIPSSANFSSINSWRAVEVLPSLPEGYKNPLLKAEVLWANGERKRVNIYNKKDTYLLLSLEEAPYSYWVDQALLYQFLQFEEESR